MELDKTTAEDLLVAIPADEDDRWEYKAAQFLEKSHRGDLKKELGKQVSAFANSGGGVLVFGISKDRKLESCEESVGNQPMKDYLATMVEQSVEQAIRHFRIHRIPMRNDPAKAIYAVSIEDSPAAPHQAKDERAYYYRIDGHSKPAPHFHLELLRHRITHAVLQVVGVDYGVESVRLDGKRRMIAHLQVTVENVSMQSTMHWGLHVSTIKPNDARWLSSEDRRPAYKGFSVHGKQLVLLPGEVASTNVGIRTEIMSPNAQVVQELDAAMENIGLRLRPVTQNSIGEPYDFTIGEDKWMTGEKHRFHQMIKVCGIAVD